MLALVLFFCVCVARVHAHGQYRYDVYLDLQRTADVVVEGTVQRVFVARDVPQARQANGMPGSDEVLRQHNLIWLRHERTHKSDNDDAPLGPSLYIHSSNIYHAPADCKEDRGLLLVPRVGDRVQAFLSRRADDASLHAIDIEILHSST